ncbi:exopolyphosphatase [Desulfoluna limicola]|uniref:Exopolyphosphatase n=2 Tax=Desulfoluna limicola TaxID=2810562 RepID=A0ABM7PA94_9BACT|nr:exopolyphosphatase [Desulfoluna limicola]
MTMRIVTRPDFDGVVCAVVLEESLTTTEPILWVEPNDMQQGKVEIRQGDAVANLPFDPGCSLWFDHHATNRVETPFEGAFEVVPSAAGLVWQYYRDRLEKDFSELIRQADRIDSADLTRDEVETPEHYPYVLLSMTIFGRKWEDGPYWDRLVGLLRTQPIEGVMADPEVKRRCEAVVAQNREYRRHLRSCTDVKEGVSITDFRGYDEAPEGNRFLVYAMYPEAVVSVKIRYVDRAKKRVVLSVGHSIFNVGCHVHAGHLLSQFNGGGHFGAAACTFDSAMADKLIPHIIGVLQENRPYEH